MPVSGKRAYEKPVLFKVELDAQQAILTACSLATMAGSAGVTTACRPGGWFPCKGAAFMGGSDSSGRPS